MRGKTIRRAVLWVAFAMLIVAIVMGALFPAGSDPLVARSWALAARGREMYLELLHGKSEWGWDTCGIVLPSCSNTAQFIEHLLSTRGTNNELADTAINIENRWNIAVSVSNDCNGTFPVMISANFNPRLLEGCVDDEKMLMIGRETGASLSLLDDRAIVLVRKDGSCEVINAKRCTRKSILGTSCAGNSSAIYLTPEGVITLHWRETFQERAMSD